MKFVHCCTIILLVFFVNVITVPTSTGMKLFEPDEREFEGNFADIVSMVCKSSDGLLFDAVLNNQADAVRWFLKQGENPNELVDGVRPLYWAIGNRNPKIIILLRQYGADPRSIVHEKINQTALECANSLLWWVKANERPSIPLCQALLDALTRPVQPIK